MADVIASGRRGVGAVADFAGANSELCAKSAKIGVSVPLVLWLRSLARCHARIAFREAKF
jgi:hypothetical protein